MLNKFIVLILTVIFYLCMRNNNIRSGKKNKIPRKYIKLVFPLLDNNINSKVDIVLFIETAYLIMACIIYYFIIIFGIIPVENATMIWGDMLIGTVLVMGGIEFIRHSFVYNIVIIIIMWIFGICFILSGVFVMLLTILGLLFQLL